MPLKDFDQVEGDQGYDGDSAVKVVEACCHCRPNNPGSQLSVGILVILLLLELSYKL